VGGVYVAGDLDKLEKELLDMTWQKTIRFFDVAFPKKGFFNGNKIYDFIDRLLIKKTFKGLKTQFCAVAVEAHTGKEVQIKEGKVADGIRASMSLPGIFTPVERKGVHLVDGGVVNPVPVNAVRKMGADIVIAVDLNHHFDTTPIQLPKKKNSKTPFTFLEQMKVKYKESSWMMRRHINKWLKANSPMIVDVLNSTINIMQNQITQKNFITDPADIVIQPKLGSIGLFDFYYAQWMINEGYKTMKKEIPKLKKQIELEELKT